MSTLYTYGCSFTNYQWDTWADHMGKNFDKFINYGQTGAGNQYILHKLTESEALGEIKLDDTVAVMWSNITRYDHWTKGKWQTGGNIYNNQYYTKEFGDYVDLVGFFIRDCSFIHAAKIILDSIGCRYIFFSMNPIDYFSDIPKFSYLDKLSDKNFISKYKKLYKETLNSICPSVFEVIWNKDWYSRTQDLLPDDKDYDFYRGADWPTLNQLESNTITEKDIDPLILEEMCNLFAAKNLDHLIKEKLYIPKDYHPTPEMHLEYLDAVLPDWRTWK